MFERDEAHIAVCEDYAAIYRNPACPLCQQMRGMEAWLPTRADSHAYWKSPEGQAFKAAVEATRPAMERLHAALKGEGDE